MHNPQEIFTSRDELATIAIGEPHQESPLPLKLASSRKTATVAAPVADHALDLAFRQATKSGHAGALSRANCQEREPGRPSLGQLSCWPRTAAAGTAFQGKVMKEHSRFHTGIVDPRKVQWWSLNCMVRPWPSSGLSEGSQPSWRLMSLGIADSWAPTKRGPLPSSKLIGAR